MKNTFRLIAITICLIAVSACNTFRGLGTDIKAAGDAIERAGH